MPSGADIPYHTPSTRKIVNRIAPDVGLGRALLALHGVGALEDHSIATSSAPPPLRSKKTSGIDARHNTIINLKSMS